MENNRNKQSDEQMLNKKEVASMWHVCTRTVERLVSSGKLRKVKILGCVRCRLSDVRRIMGVEPNMNPS